MVLDRLFLWIFTVAVLVRKKAKRDRKEKETIKKRERKEKERKKKRERKEKKKARQNRKKLFC